MIVPWESVWRTSGLCWRCGPPASFCLRWKNLSDLKLDRYSMSRLMDGMIVFSTPLSWSYRVELV